MRLRLVNRADRTQAYQVEAIQPEGMRVTVIDDEGMNLESGGTSTVPVSIEFPAGLTGAKGRAEAKVRVTDDAGNERVLDFRLLGPRR